MFSAVPREPQPTIVDRLLKARPPWFWWGVALSLACCFSLLSWSLCIAVFENPEIPRNYAILKKIDRLPQPKSYTFETAPKLQITTPEALRSRYIQFPPKELDTINQSLLRSYLKNYQDKTFAEYLQGSFEVISSRRLNKADLIQSGFVVQLRSFTQNDEYSRPSPFPAIVELILPSQANASSSGFKKGDSVDLDIAPHFASLLHLRAVENADDDPIIHITVVSLADSINSPHAGIIKLSPPAEINIRVKPPVSP